MTNIKNTPPVFEKALPVVQDHYPELTSVNIIFSEKNLSLVKRFSTMLRCHPISLGKPRNYGIIVNTNPQRVEVKLSEIPLPARIGLLAHEFAHIVDYEGKNLLDLIVMFVRYRWMKSERRKIEHAIDEMAIHHGLGTELKAWAQYSMHDSSASEHYKTLKKDIYLSPEMIQLKIDALNTTA